METADSKNTISGHFNLSDIIFCLFSDRRLFARPFVARLHLFSAAILISRQASGTLNVSVNSLQASRNSAAHGNNAGALMQ